MLGVLFRPLTEKVPCVCEGVLGAMIGDVGCELGMRDCGAGGRSFVALSTISCRLKENELAGSRVWFTGFGVTVVLGVEFAVPNELKIESKLNAMFVNYYTKGLNA